MIQTHLRQETRDLREQSWGKVGAGTARNLPPFHTGPPMRCVCESRSLVAQRTRRRGGVLVEMRVAMRAEMRVAMRVEMGAWSTGSRAALTDSDRGWMDGS